MQLSEVNRVVVSEEHHADDCTTQRGEISKVVSTQSHNSHIWFDTLRTTSSHNGPRVALTCKHVVHQEQHDQDVDDATHAAH